MARTGKKSQFLISWNEFIQDYQVYIILEISLIYWALSCLCFDEFMTLHMKAFYDIKIEFKFRLILTKVDNVSCPVKNSHKNARTLCLSHSASICQGQINCVTLVLNLKGTLLVKHYSPISVVRTHNTMHITGTSYYMSRLTLKTNLFCIADQLFPCLYLNSSQWALNSLSFLYRTKTPHYIS